MSQYIHELARWPNFYWDSAVLAAPLAALRHRQGKLMGRMETLAFSLRAEAALQMLTTEITKSSEIEGEILDRGSVRSSIARRLGMGIGALTPAERHVEGVVEMTLDATQNYSAPLTAARLFGWHAALFPTGYSGMRKIAVGRWRDDSRGPMQVVSGRIGQERVHFETPPAARLDPEMSAFLRWFETKDATDPVLRAGLAHLWFVTLHPFDDGNGRIARAIADMVLARSDKSAERFYSMSAQIRIERDDYYQRLEKTQAGGLDITPYYYAFRFSPFAQISKRPRP
jgi:Fic family protein